MVFGPLRPPSMAFVILLQNYNMLKLPMYLDIILKSQDISVQDSKFIEVLIQRRLLTICANNLIKIPILKLAVELMRA